MNDKMNSTAGEKTLQVADSQTKFLSYTDIDIDKIFSQQMWLQSLEAEDRKS